MKNVKNLLFLPIALICSVNYGMDDRAQRREKMARAAEARLQQNQNNQSPQHNARNMEAFLRGTGDLRPFFESMPDLNDLLANNNNAELQRRAYEAGISAQRALDAQITRNLDTLRAQANRGELDLSDIPAPYDDLADLHLPVDELDLSDIPAPYDDLADLHLPVDELDLSDIPAPYDDLADLHLPDKSYY